MITELIPFLFSVYVTVEEIFLDNPYGDHIMLTYNNFDRGTVIIIVGLH